MQARNVGFMSATTDELGLGPKLAIEDGQEGVGDIFEGGDDDGGGAMYVGFE